MSDPLAPPAGRCRQFLRSGWGRTLELGPPAAQLRVIAKHAASKTSGVGSQNRQDQASRRQTSEPRLCRPDHAPGGIIAFLFLVSDFRFWGERWSSGARGERCCAAGGGPRGAGQNSATGSTSIPPRSQPHELGTASTSLAVNPRACEARWFRRRLTSSKPKFRWQRRAKTIS